MAVTFDQGGQELRVWGLVYDGTIGRAVWSPGGDRLALQARPPTGIEVVLLIDLAARREIRIGGIEDGFQASEPTWAPDGRRLALVTRPVRNPRRADGLAQLRSYTPDGSLIAVIATGAIAGPDWNPAEP